MNELGCNEGTDYRVFVPTPRSSPSFARAYRRRTSVERFNARIDQVLGFETTRSAVSRRCRPGWDRPWPLPWLWPSDTCAKADAITSARLCARLHATGPCSRKQPEAIQKTHSATAPSP